MAARARARDFHAASRQVHRYSRRRVVCRRDARRGNRAGEGSAPGGQGASQPIHLPTENGARLWKSKANGNSVKMESCDFIAVTDPTALDLSVLGSDILDLFALIVDRPGNTVCLLSRRHRYEIIQD